MAAIVQPHRLATDRRSPSRPDLRLLPGGTNRGARVRPGSSPALVVGLVVVALLVAMVGAVAVGRGALAGLAPAPVGAAPAPAAPAPGAAGAEIVVVQPGDTLWSIARRIDPSGDVRPLVDRLVAANGGTVLQPGQELIVPG